MQAAAAAGLRVFGMGEAAARRHEIDLAGRDQLLIAEAVTVNHRALDHPGEGLQPDVRMGSDAHAATGPEFHRPGMIEEAPGSDRAAPPVRQRTPDDEPAADFGGTCFNAFKHGVTSSPVTRCACPARARAVPPPHTA